MNMHLSCFCNLTWACWIMISMVKEIVMHNECLKNWVAQMVGVKHCERDAH